MEDKVISKLWLVLLLLISISFLASCKLFDTNMAAVADFSYQQLYPVVDEEISFTDNSADPDGEIVEWSWDFGDGTSRAVQNPKHSYQEAGQYTVCLNVKSNDGGSDAICKDISVAVEPNSPPVANFSYSYSTYNPGVGDPVMFDASASDDPDGDIVSYQWDFGDGDSESGVVVTHSYMSKGAYTITLTVEDDKGATDSMSIDITVGTGDGDCGC